MIRSAFLSVAALASWSCGAAAQTYLDKNGTNVPAVVPLVGCATNAGCSGPVSSTNPLPASDPNNLAFQGAVTMTVGTVYASQRSVGVLATSGGNVVFQFPDSSTLTLPVAVGWQTFPFACTEILSAGTTATATYFNLK